MYANRPNLCVLKEIGVKEHDDDISREFLRRSARVALATSARASARLPFCAAAKRQLAGSDVDVNINNLSADRKDGKTTIFDTT